MLEVADLVVGAMSVEVDALQDVVQLVAVDELLAVMFV
jgi:hypothetical protein